MSGVYCETYPEVEGKFLQHSLKVRHGHEYGRAVSVVIIGAGLVGKGMGLFRQVLAPQVTL